MRLTPMFRKIGLLALLTSLFYQIQACQKADDTPKIEIENIWSRPVQIENEDGRVMKSNGVVYLKIVNDGEAPDRLMSITSIVCDVVELHETKMNDDRMMMQKVDGGLDIPAGQTVEFKPGGYHVMLIGLKRSLVPGDRFALQLVFERTGTIKVDSEVGQP